MRYRINQIKLNMDQGHEAFEGAIRKKLKRRKLAIYDISIVKESIDARKKPDIKLVYTLDFSCDEKLPLQETTDKNYDTVMADRMKEYREKAEILTQKKNFIRPVIIGFGPCGIFAALILAEAGLKPLVLERGQDVDRRIESVERFWKEGKLDPESNVQFGEGGAGTFSDGKLTTGTKDIRISKVLQEFVSAGADKRILYKQKPHIGTDKLREVVKSLRKKIEALGGEIRFDTRLEDIIVAEESEDSGKQAVKAIIAGGVQIPAEHVILAIGHSARDTFQMLFEKGISMEQKPFSIGIRVEHPQEMIDSVQYGDPRTAQRLGAADYKLNHRCENGRGVYTFCMCPGGEVVNAASEAGMAVTNGMSNSARDGEFANSGLLVDVRTSDFSSDHPLAGVEFQRKYERLAYQNGGGRLPQTNYRAFQEDREDPVRKSLPEFASEAIIEAMPHLGRRLQGFDGDDVKMTGVETRSSSPVRILRHEDGQTDIRGLYPAGEGPGYAGGIVSAAVDGIRTAEKIMAVIFS